MDSRADFHHKLNWALLFVLPVFLGPDDLKKLFAFLFDVKSVGFKEILKMAFALWLGFDQLGELVSLLSEEILPGKNPVSRDVVVALSVAKEVFPNLLKIVEVLLLKMEQIDPRINGQVRLHLVDLWHVLAKARHGVSPHFGENKKPNKAQLVVVRHENQLLKKLGLVY